MRDDLCFGAAAGLAGRQALRMAAGRAGSDAPVHRGEHGLVLPFQNISGLYQAAFFAYLTGREPEFTPLTFMWALPAVGDHVPVRKFPGSFDSP